MRKERRAREMRRDSQGCDKANSTNVAEMDKDYNRQPTDQPTDRPTNQPTSQPANQATGERDKAKLRGKSKQVEKS